TAEPVGPGPDGVGPPEYMRDPTSPTTTIATPTVAASRPIPQDRPETVIRLGTNCTAPSAAPARAWTAYSPTASAIPLRRRRPRRVNVKSWPEPAMERTVSDTSTSPAGAWAQIRAAGLTGRPGEADWVGG